VIYKDAMRTRIAAPALLGALALTALAAPGTASAATAPAKPVVTSATMTSFAPGLTGVLKPSLRVSAFDAKGVKSIKVLPIPDPMAAHITAKDLAELGITPTTLHRTRTTLTVGATLPFDAASGKDRLPDAVAGHWTIMVLVTGNDGHITFAPHAGGFTVKRADVLSAKADAAKVHKGATVTFKGRLNRADWDKGVWAGNGGQTVQLQFRNSHGAWVTKAVARTSATGAVNISARDYASGSWRVLYNGNAVSGAAVSGAGFVVVK
jgi:hypothetical protein